MAQNPLNHLLKYNMDIGKTKPDTVHRKATYCPFCDVTHLKNILEKRGTMIWLENAYPVLKDSWQTLIIESDDCNGDFSTYTPSYALRLVEFCLEKWHQVKAMHEFASVLFYRNYGYMAGGSIHHPHTQIVGLKHYDYHEDIKHYHFVGTPILLENTVELNLSLRPIIGFYEINFILKDLGALACLVRYMQKTARFLLRRFGDLSHSYNIFYYDFPDDTNIYIKMVPRFLTNPLFVGYMVPQIATEEAAEPFVQHLRQAVLT